MLEMMRRVHQLNRCLWRQHNVCLLRVWLMGRGVVVVMVVGVLHVGGRWTGRHARLLYDGRIRHRVLPVVLGVHHRPLL